MNSNNILEVVITYPGKVEPGRTVSEFMHLYRKSSVRADAHDLMEHTVGVSVPDYLEFMESITRAEAVMTADRDAYMVVTYRLDGEEVDAVIERVPEDCDGLIDPYVVKTDPGEDENIYSISDWISNLVVSLIKKEV